MAFLSDRDIQQQLDCGGIVVSPDYVRPIQPASLEFRLGNKFRIYPPSESAAGNIVTLDPTQDNSPYTALMELYDSEPLVVLPGQFLLGMTMERISLRSPSIAAQVGGKALALTTEIPTPQGWRKMGDLQPGDQVYTLSGQPTRVVAISEVLFGEECFEVHFSDGASVVTDGNHSWMFSDGKMSTSSAMALNCAVPQGRWMNHKYRMPHTGPIRYGKKSLPIHPYVLGIWLGDGTSSNGNITNPDTEIRERIESLGYPTKDRATQLGITYHVGQGRIYGGAQLGEKRAGIALQATLRKIGLLENKHIPAKYLMGSREQRWELLKGLMDADGYCDERGKCEYTTVREGLADSMVQLLDSLGIHSQRHSGIASYRGKVTGPKYRIVFTPKVPVFHLSRKLNKLKRGRAQHDRVVLSINRVPSVPVRCIQVAHRSGIFLVGRKYIPTHNSSLGRLGLLIHATAGWADPGWDGNLTLEISNLNSIPIALRPGMVIGQLTFVHLQSPCERPYGHPQLHNHYQGDSLPEGSKCHLQLIPQ